MMYDVNSRSRNRTISVAWIRMNYYGTRTTVAVTERASRRARKRFSYSLQVKGLRTNKNNIMVV